MQILFDISILRHKIECVFVCILLMEISAQIYQMNIISDIRHRFARTIIITKIKNSRNSSKEIKFRAILPDTAFITSFVMKIGDKNYTAYLKDTEEAKLIYKQALDQSTAAGTIELDVRDSRNFFISVNLEQRSEAVFYLTYEELLQRKNGFYEHILNLCADQPVANLQVQVNIVETKKITQLKVPPLRLGSGIEKEDTKLNPNAKIKITKDTSALVKFNLNTKFQRMLQKRNRIKGLLGQVVMQYDIERNTDNGEIIMKNGYFVHFFSPTKLDPIPKHVVFVLESATVNLWKEAMIKIMDYLHNFDVFSLVQIKSNAKVIDINDDNSSVRYPFKSKNYKSRKENIDLEEYLFPKAYLANPDNTRKSKSAILNIKKDDTYDVDIYNALKVGLYLVELERKEKRKDNITRQPLMLLLSAGLHTGSSISTDGIVYEITKFNGGLRRTPIITLSFGKLANKSFLQQLALRNFGFSKQIYDATDDVSLQIEDFYKQISSPLLVQITFNYHSYATNLTKIEHPIYFNGSELIVCGSCRQSLLCVPKYSVCGRGEMNGVCLRLQGESIKQSQQEQELESIVNIERLWAFLKISQSLEEEQIMDDKGREEIRKKIVDLALKYSFVTPYTSLVVVKPNRKKTVYSIDKVNLYEEEKGRKTRPRETPLHKKGPVFLKKTLLSPYTHSWKSASENIGEIEKIQPFNVVESLPWLETILKNDTVLQLPTGNYQLGLNVTLKNGMACQRTPLNSTGHCSLLHACPRMYSYLESLYMYNMYFCVLQKKYAGVCCPD
ncbi:hypothetical protein ILUMI_07057 [Ignelater luminosus]|uniref:VIT domain-containing protein n=1 Tax=Ignelater luminosus TaxID=2038154 RepID=A0A8K0D9H2_IGNLU|nr:hypothetical protein ILUMI_07057 [Ignelater luminosus]